MELKMKRAYEEASPDDGFRVLVDRLWPRGVSKERAAIDLWAKDVAPSPELRTAWHHSPTESWSDFAEDYRRELRGPTAAALAELRETLVEHPVVTLVYATKDEEHNHVVILEEFLE